MKEEKPKSKYIFTDEQIRNIAELGEVLQKIRADLIRQGVNIEEDKKQFYKETGGGIM